MLKILKWEFIKNIESMKLLYLLVILPPLLIDNLSESLRQ